MVKSYILLNIPLILVSLNRFLLILKPVESIESFIIAVIWIYGYHWLHHGIS